MNAESFLTVAERFGVWAAFCIALVVAVLFFAWRRETRMAARIDALERDSKDAAIAVARALEANGEVLKQVVHLQERVIGLQEEILKELRALNVEMRVRPCLRHTREVRE